MWRIDFVIFFQLMLMRLFPGQIFVKTNRGQAGPLKHLLTYGERVKRIKPWFCAYRSGLPKRCGVSLSSGILVFMAMTLISSPALSAPPAVILLHGLCRTSHSMASMQRALIEAGYQVENVDYPSRTAPIQRLADEAIGKAVDNCRRGGATEVDFVTHSLGGILVRSYLARHPLPSRGRVVMLAPPNQGSEVVDKLSGWFLFKWINGPAGNELGTDANSTPNRLGTVNYPVGVIAGDRSINWINSLLIPGRDDGKVSIERTKLAGMSDHIVIHATHPFIMKNREAVRQTIQFLRTGAFDHGAG
jgi:triacylglycerol lipase